MLSWTLSNPHNICYLNSVTSAMLWMQISSGCDPEFAFGKLRAAFQAVLSARVTCIPSLFHWHGLLTGVEFHPSAFMHSGLRPDFFSFNYGTTLKDGELF